MYCSGPLYRRISHGVSNSVCVPDSRFCSANPLAPIRKSRTITERMSRVLCAGKILRSGGRAKDPRHMGQVLPRRARAAIRDRWRGYSEMERERGALSSGNKPQVFSGESESIPSSFGRIHRMYFSPKKADRDLCPEDLYVHKRLGFRSVSSDIPWYVSCATVGHGTHASKPPCII